MSTRILNIAAAAALCSGLAASGAAMAQGAASWPTAGHDLQNARYQQTEARIRANSVGALQLRWSFQTDGEVTATPAVDGDALYFPDAAGSLYKVNRLTGALVWKKPIAGYTGIAGDFARATPAISGNTLVLGNQSGKFLQAFGQPAPQPAQVFAVDKQSGNLIWRTQVDNTQYSFITNSAVIANGMAIVGVASNEELIAGFVPAPPWQFQFRGSVVALDLATGKIAWKTYTVPAGYSGGGVWGSTGAVDPKKQLVYMASGNNYSVPQSVLDCLNANGSPPTCMSPDNHFDSIIAMDLASGAIVWAARGLPYDQWNVGCGLNVPGFTIAPNNNCPNPKGPDWDFAQGPMLLTDNNSSRRLVGAGQKSGMFWAFDADTGALVWSTQAAPPGLTGGLQWGSANDTSRIYVAASNAGPTGAGQAPLPWALKQGGTTLNGGWAALDAKTGAIQWTTADPISGGRAEGAVSVANDVVLGCSLDPHGNLYALNALTGAVLWQYASGRPCNAGAAIVDGMVYWGTGTFNPAAGAGVVHAFGL